MVDKVKMFPVYYELFLVWKVEKRVYKKKKSFDFFFFNSRTKYFPYTWEVFIFYVIFKNGKEAKKSNKLVL